jgi:hypothetical protein
MQSRDRGCRTMIQPPNWTALRHVLRCTAGAGVGQVEPSCRQRGRQKPGTVGGFPLLSRRGVLRSPDCAETRGDLECAEVERLTTERCSSNVCDSLCKWYPRPFTKGVHLGVLMDSFHVRHLFLIAVGSLSPASLFTKPFAITLTTIK